MEKIHVKIEALYTNAGGEKRGVYADELTVRISPAQYEAALELLRKVSRDLKRIETGTGA